MENPESDYPSESEPSSNCSDSDSSDQEMDPILRQLKLKKLYSELKHDFSFCMQENYEFIKLQTDKKSFNK
jgi:hypothetical protein